ncbi:DUF2278 family protein [Lacibacterium aquatile]|uniref:DUF2278 family protein n=1 Tax=Lacibacterium aquatile TaxID=1168082 RepID=A0ABW5DX60_9PROT
MLKQYAMLKGRPVEWRRGQGKTPHFQIRVSSGRQSHRASVNIRSALWPSELEVALIEPFDHPLTERLWAMPPGLHLVARRPGGIALDYIRAGICQPADFKPLPDFVEGPDNDLNDLLMRLMSRVARDRGAFLAIYGEPWGPWPLRRDRQFGFIPSRGMHDIHMNQGNSAEFLAQNGCWQDGGLLACLPEEKTWVALLLKFQSQSWATEDASGHATTMLAPPMVSA